MSLVNRISHLNHLPELLKHKLEDEEHRRRREEKQKEREEKLFQSIEDEVTITQSSKAHHEVQVPTKPLHVQEKSNEEGVGEKIDLRA